ncbi:hypothetical protein Hanom_Chr16g01479681 [Helianthus anomalus]
MVTCTVQVNNALKHCCGIKVKKTSFEGGKGNGFWDPQVEGFSKLWVNRVARLRWFI